MIKILMGLLFFFFCSCIIAQNLTGIWHATITKKGNNLLSKKYKLEVKIIATGDSIKGTSYYYQSKNNYARYSINGFRNPVNGEVKWWDDKLIEAKSPQIKLNNATASAFNITADFSCPNGGTMYLNGAADVYNNGQPTYNFNGEKVNNSIFNDEWDYLIANFYLGANTKQNIDSTALIAFNNTATIASNNTLLKNNTNIINQKIATEKVATKNGMKVVTMETVVANTEAEGRLIIKKMELEEANNDTTSFVSNPFYKANNNKNNANIDTLKTDALINKNQLAINNQNNTIQYTNSIANVNSYNLKTNMLNQPKNNETPKDDYANANLVQIDSLRSYVSTVIPKSDPTYKPNNINKPPVIAPQAASNKNNNKVDTINNLVIAKQPFTTAINKPSAVVIPSFTITSKLETRKTLVATSIPIFGDTIILNFYDNGILDGDSIGVFVNKVLVAQNVLLSYDPYQIKIATNTLLDNNEIVMVAENLGAIPPNTSTVVVYVAGKRYEVNMESSEQKSASIKFYKPTKK